MLRMLNLQVPQPTSCWEGLKLLPFHASFWCIRKHTEQKIMGCAKGKQFKIRSLQKIHTKLNCICSVYLKWMVHDHLTSSHFLKKKIKNAGVNGRVPDFVFLAHIVDMSSAMHAPFLVRSMASLPFYTRLYLIPLWPISFAVMLLMWAKSKTFLVSFYHLRNRLHQTWVVPRFGFQVRTTAPVLA